MKNYDQVFIPPTCLFILDYKHNRISHIKIFSMKLLTPYHQKYWTTQQPTFLSTL